MTTHFSLGVTAAAALGMAIGFTSFVAPASAEDVYIEEEVIIEETYEEVYEETYEEEVIEETYEEEIIEETYEEY